MNRRNVIKAALGGAALLFGAKQATAAPAQLTLDQMDAIFEGIEPAPQVEPLVVPKGRVDVLIGETGPEAVRTYTEAELMDPFAVFYGWSTVGSFYSRQPGADIKVHTRWASNDGTEGISHASVGHIGVMVTRRDAGDTGYVEMRFSENDPYGITVAQPVTYDAWRWGPRYELSELARDLFAAFDKKRLVDQRGSTVNVGTISTWITIHEDQD